MTGFYDVLCFLYYLMSIIAILVIIVFFQNWKSLQEEQLGQELLESQINNIKMHIKEVENCMEISVLCAMTWETISR